MISFNTKHELFQDPALRRALNLAIDRVGLVEHAFHGLAHPVSFPMNPENWACPRDLPSLPYDPGKALEMLQKAGWKDSDQDGILDKEGFPLRFTVLVDKGDTQKKNVVNRLSLTLSEIGVIMEPRFIERDRLIRDYLIPRKFQAVLAQFCTQDPDFCHVFWHSHSIKNGLNCFGYQNKDVDEALDQGRRSFDTAERKAAYARFLRAFMKDPPAIPLYYPFSFMAADKRIRGIRYFGTDSLRDIEHWKLD